MIQLSEHQLRHVVTVMRKKRSHYGCHQHPKVFLEPRKTETGMVMACPKCDFVEAGLGVYRNYADTYMHSVFILGPVRNSTVKEKLEAYAEKLEKKGYFVHLPHRDTPQDDPVGFDICMTNAGRICRCDEIHIWYDETSGGSKFDLGALFMVTAIMGHLKKVVIINRREARLADCPEKSFFKVQEELVRRINNAIRRKKRQEIINGNNCEAMKAMHASYGRKKTA